MSVDEAAALGPAWWPLDRLADGLQALVQDTGWMAGEVPALGAPPPDLKADHGRASRWLDWAASRLGVEVEPVQVPVVELPELLRRAGPALVPWERPGHGIGFLLLCGTAGGRVTLLGPDRRRHRLAPATLRAALARHHEDRWRPAIDALLAEASIAPRQRPAAARALLRERLAGDRLAPWWLLRLPATAPLWTRARAARLPGRLAVLLAGAAALYLGEAAGWALLGRGILDGVVEQGWLLAWSLVLLLMLVLQLGTLRLDQAFARGVALLLKSRLLAGALRLDLDQVRRLGVGELQGRVLEAQALESLVVDGVVASAVAAIELTVAAGVLALGVAPLGHLALLAGWLLVAAALCARLAMRQRRWTDRRLQLSHRLIEQMIGHRTRLAQEQGRRRDAEEDQALGGYAGAAAAMDRSEALVRTALPTAWLVAALAVWGLAMAGGPAPAAALAISLGGILLAQRAGLSLTAGLVTLGRAWQAGVRVQDLLRSGTAQPQDAPAVFVDETEGPAPDGTLLQARGLRFAHAGAPEPVIAEADLRVASGDKLLLQGPSGGGKSTLAALLAGLRPAQGGLLTLAGLDPASMGRQWQSRVTLAPQFHENHVLSGTLAFNLLLGRHDPDDAAALAEAQTLCEELGLGPLVERMPAGLQQRIGETGWQLSHGERARLFLARALLQRAPLTLLDEAFGALDPHTLARCLDAVQRRTDALLVIAHP